MQIITVRSYSLLEAINSEKLREVLKRQNLQDWLIESILKSAFPPLKYVPAAGHAFRVVQSGVIFIRVCEELEEALTKRRKNPTHKNRIWGLSTETGRVLSFTPSSMTEFYKVEL